MEIPREHLSSALKALEKDSQRGIFGRRKEKVTLTRMECDRIAIMLQQGLNSPVGLHTTQEEFKKLILGETVGHESRILVRGRGTAFGQHPTGIRANHETMNRDAKKIG